MEHRKKNELKKKKNTSVHFEAISVDPTYLFVIKVPKAGD
jgi:hypothetical protein